MIILPSVHAESSLKAAHGSQLQRLHDMLSGWVRVHDDDVDLLGLSD